ncbi:MAG: dehypoxanthine futalosine cyclase [Planctomycetes bacterium]|nr:dehypoxanthine futalosine cyclase [Planctomycetota bacterium]
MSSKLEEINEKVINGERISDEDVDILFKSTDLVTLGKMADAVRNRIHQNSKTVTYIVDRNINYTNVCVAYCDFCAFYRPPKHSEGYVLSKDALAKKIVELKEIGGIQILLQGGHNPDLKLEWYEDLLFWIKHNFDIHIHGFSPPEIVHFAKLNRLPVSEVLTRLKKAGLDSLPGGGAEILGNQIRKELARNRASADEWIDVMRAWHKLGGKSSSTMVIGHIESIKDRIEHLNRLRQIQDETGGFTAFILWTMQTTNTGLKHIPTLGSYEYLKTLAISRIYLDNIENFQSSWVTQGMQIGQIALKFGCNDMGSVMMEENVVSSAGTTFRTSEKELRQLITECGYIPKKRNYYYKVIE